MYTQEEKKRALKCLKKNGMRYKRTIIELGYPSITLLKIWEKKIANPGTPEQVKKRQYSLIRSRVYCTVEEKLQAIHRCYDLGESPKKVAKEMGLSRGSVISNWRREYKEKGYLTSVKEEREITPPAKIKKTENSSDSFPETYEGMKAAYEALQKEKNSYLEERKQLLEEHEKIAMERDILVKTLEILKKDPGVNPETLSNREKVVIIDALGERYSRPVLRRRLHLYRSSYYDARLRLSQKDKYYEIRQILHKIFEESRRTYGYRRIWRKLKTRGICLSEKIVRQLMKQEGLFVICHKKSRYQSYKGEITPAPDNILNRNFHAQQPNEKWVTDITEFHIPVGKVYLSPILDCYDGMDSQP